MNQTQSDNALDQAGLRHLVSIAQSICLSHAMQVARAIDTKQPRFGNSLALLPELQSAVTAAGALMDGIVQRTDPAQQDLCVRHLKIILCALESMPSTYQPGQVMIQNIREFLHRRGFSPEIVE